MNQSSQLDRNLDPDHHHRLVIMLVSRVAVMTALLVSTTLFNLKAGVPRFSASQLILYSTILLVYLLTGAYFLFVKRVSGRIGMQFHLQVNITVDVLVATVLVYLTGGVESPFTFLYALPIINTAVFFPYLGTFLTAGLSCLFLGALLILENQEIIPVDLEIRTKAPPSGGRIIYLLALNYTVFLTIAWLSSYLGDLLRRTGRKLMLTESDLEKVTALNRDIIISLRSGLVVLDSAKRISLLNPVAEEILGTSSATALGSHVEKIFPSLMPLLEQPWSENYNRLDVDHLRSGDGTTIPVGLTISTLQSSNNLQAGILVHMQDLTTRKKMEASVKRAERMAALGTMAAGMAHEIRNPLASISGSVQMLKGSDRVSNREKRLMGIILRETQRLDTLLADFLAYARPKAPQPNRCDLKELVEETVSVFLHQANNQPVRVARELAPVHAMVDPDQVRQVLWNLLSNAAYAIAHNGQITVRIGCEQESAETECALLEVADQGPGIPVDLRERIFYPFFTTKEDGNGLGLATVNRIVEDHGGSIQLICPEEGGSRFVIRLPGVYHE